VYAGLQINTALSHYSTALISKSSSSSNLQVSSTTAAEKELQWFTFNFDTIFNVTQFLGVKSQAMGQCAMILKILPVQRSLTNIDTIQEAAEDAEMESYIQYHDDNPCDEDETFITVL
jgi:hypothetical protein